MNYDTVIGIEIHIELKTNSKMFSGAPYSFKASANTCTNEIDLALPGSLPCVNKQAVVKALQACYALNLEIDPLIRFDRKNYYYSDLPKGFQITQQFHPLGKNGYVNIETEEGVKKIRINRIHMEEDTAKQFHLRSQSLIDYNRAGVPLIEVVSEPDISSGEEAGKYVENLKQIVEYLEVSDAKMEEGSMRCDINISVKEEGSSKLGTKVEIKNLNSIANIVTAIEYERQRQIDALQKGEVILQETRRFDEKNNVTTSMRKKEGSVDYKYFPEPNIFPIRLSEDFLNEVKNNLPELPEAKAKRFKEDYQLNDYDASLLISNKAMCSYFEEGVKQANNPKSYCNLITSELAGLLAKNSLDFENSSISANNLAKLSNMVEDNKISGKQAKELLTLIDKDQDPEVLAKEKGMEQLSDDGLILDLVKQVINENPQSIIDFKNGKTHVQGFLVGQVMKKSQGKADPRKAAQLVAQELAKS